MKISKLSFLTVLALGGLIAAAQITRADDEKPAPKKAQTDGGEGKERPEGRKGGPGGGAEMMKKMAEELKLTDDQKPKFEAIMKEQGEKMREVFQDQNLSREDKQAKMKELREANQAKIKAILTPEQAEKYEKMQSEMRARFGNREGKKKKQE